MTGKRIIPAFICFLAISVFAFSPLKEFSPKTQYASKSLFGLNEVYVKIDHFAPELEKEGLDKEDMAMEIKSKLLEAGIQVLTEEEWSENKELACLYVDFDIRKLEDYTYICLVKLDLWQPVILERDPSITAMASTWNATWVGLVEESRLLDIQEIVFEKVDEFIAEFLAVNSTQDIDQPTNETERTRSFDMDKKESKNTFFDTSECKHNSSEKCIPPEVILVEIIHD